jgi:hypothetical protein
LNPSADSILRCLQGVAAERTARAADPGLAERVAAVKAFQHGRFARTYADLLADKRYAKAATFFLEDLYGPRDFTERDTQFVRIVPALVRMFPREIVGTVADLAELHALSEKLDSAMAHILEAPAIDGLRYAQAWRTVGEPAAREKQISLMLAVGTALDKYTRNPVLRHSLRLMRSPAKAAGMGALQNFLETGFDTFRAMRGAEEFLRTIAQRERALAARLFAGGEIVDSAAG